MVRTKPARRAARHEIAIATWNVNSVRIRLDALARLAASPAPDVICLQETKVVDDAFPRDFCVDLGYAHIALAGQKMYSGVAILSKLPLELVTRRTWCGKDDSRHIAALLPGGIELHNFYVPAGGDVPDRTLNDKFAHKLDFVSEVTDFFRARAQVGNREDSRLVLVGDLNIAPLETDVWSHKQLLTVVSHTPVEVAAMAELQKSHDWVDAVRAIIPPTERLYSWWSYRSPDWESADKGRRLDHIWITPALVPALRDALVVKALRGTAQPSDHAPVVVRLAR